MTASRKARRERCGACRFWNRAKRDTWTDFDGSPAGVLVEHAQCRRSAPVPLYRGQGALADAKWPEVSATDWCGQFEAAP